ncbi:MAG: hypothetical protein JSR82_12470 [Verrucomicrobia bacterium]|nr:hypothetical protein [Verrucomicrobiota bacterium]
MLSTVLLAAAGAIYVFLGGAHGWFTWQDARSPRILVPRDPALVEAMRGMPLRIHPTTDFWRAWIGFNFTHSLGVALFGGILLASALLWPEPFRSSWLLRGGCLAIAVLYVVLARAYFFSKPLAASTVALALLIAASFLA